jgi:hypothetical protein
MCGLITVGYDASTHPRYVMCHNKLYCTTPLKVQNVPEEKFFTGTYPQYVMKKASTHLRYVKCYNKLYSTNPLNIQHVPEVKFIPVPTHSP